MRFDPGEFVAIAREELEPRAHARSMLLGHINATPEYGAISYGRGGWAVVLLADPTDGSVDLRFGRARTDASYGFEKTHPLKNGGRSLLQLSSLSSRHSPAQTPRFGERRPLRKAVQALMRVAEGHASRVFGPGIWRIGGALAERTDASCWQFQDLVAREMKPLIQKYGLLPTYLHYIPRGHILEYSNGRRAISFQLEVVDAYMDVSYGPAKEMPEGTPGGSWWTGSLRQRLHDEGISFPNGSRELYKPGQFEEAVRLLVKALQRHEGTVFGSDGSDWNADGA